MNTITTHVLDTARGRPAAGIALTLERQTDTGTWQSLASGATNADGRLAEWLPQAPPVVAGTYRLTFDTGTYFATQQIAAFYPSVTILFHLAHPTEHYHIPLLLSPFGYSTYRGS